MEEPPTQPPTSAAPVFRGVRFDVQRVELPTDDGRRATREFVRPADAVVILPLLPGGEVVLIRNRRFAVDRTLWELPAGTMEPGEDPATTAARELVEETGYRADRVEPMTRFYASPGFCTELLHAFRATGLTEVGQALDDTEQITTHPTPWDEAMRMCRDGDITDAKTLAALLHHHAFGR